MTDRLTNIEFLLMLSDDVKAQGDELTVEINQRGAAHARRVLELINMLDKARQLLEREKQRFGVYLPQQVQHEPMPRVVTKARAAGE